MKFLECIKEGTKKNFDLDFNNGTIILGRNRACDIIIDNEYISKQHIQLKIDADNVIIEHLSEKNPIYIDGKSFSSATLKIDDHFTIADIQFYLREKQEENKIFNIGSGKQASKIETRETETKANLQLFDKGKLFTFDLQNRAEKPENIFKAGYHSITAVFSTGHFYLVERLEESIKILDACHLDKKADTEPSEEVLRDVFRNQVGILKIKKKQYRCFKIFNSKSIRLSLVYSDWIRNELTSQKLNFINDFISEFIGIYRNLHPRSKQQGIPDKPIVTNSRLLLDKLKQLRNIAKSNLRVLIQGETGVGKELISQFIFTHFSRNRNSLIAINCSTLPSELIEAELFGNEKGAFTDAKNTRKGKIEEADQGTLVLDEIGELPLSAQAKLLRALQEKVITRLGSNHTIPVDFNLISMTNRNLKQMVSEGNFREDLYFRIKEFLTVIPPLRERKEDIQPLIEHFIEKHRKTSYGYHLSFTENALKQLEDHPWTGNVRELESLVKTLIAISEPGELITEQKLNEILDEQSSEEKSSSPQKDYIIDALNKFRWNKTKTAKYLNISRTELYRRLNRYNINENEGI